MSSFEVGFCPVEEYYAGEDDRLMEDELCVEGLYVMLLYLKKRSRVEKAVKYPTRLNDIEQQDADFYRVNFSILNVDLTPKFTTEGMLRDGFWQKKASPGFAIGKIPVQKGYFRDYYQAADEELAAMLNVSLERPPEEGCFSLH